MIQQAITAASTVFAKHRNTGGGGQETPNAQPEQSTDQEAPPENSDGEGK